MNKWAWIYPPEFIFHDCHMIWSKAREKCWPNTLISYEALLWSTLNVDYIFVGLDITCLIALLDFGGMVQSQ